MPRFFANWTTQKTKFRRLPVKLVQRTLNAFNFKPADVRIAHGGFHIAVSQKGLNVENVRSSLQEVGGIAVPVSSSYIKFQFEHLC